MQPLATDQEPAASPLGLYLLHLWMPMLMAAALVVALRDAAPTLAPSPTGLGLLLLGVFAVYTGDRVVDPVIDPMIDPASSPPNQPRVRVLLGLATLGACGLLAVLALRRSDLWPPLLTLSTAALAYPWLKRQPLLRLSAVAGSWTIGCMRLPWHTPAQLLNGHGGLVILRAVGVACAIAAGTVLCDLKDRESDAQRGIRSLPVLLGSERACACAAALALAGALAALQAGALLLMCCNLAMLVLAGFPASVQRPVRGPLLVDAALATPGSALWLAHVAQHALHSLHSLPSLHTWLG